MGWVDGWVVGWVGLVGCLVGCWLLVVWLFGCLVVWLFITLCLPKVGPKCGDFFD